MGNIGSSCSNCWRSFGKRGNRRSHSHPQPPQPELTNKNVFAAAYTSQYPNPPPPDTPYYQNPNGGACYPAPPFPTSPLSATDDDDHRTPMDRALEAWVDGIYPPSPLVDRQTFTIRNNVNLKKETLKIEADEENPGKVLISFTFDASVPCNISLYFFAKEGEDGGLTTIKEDSLPPLKFSFQQGLGQIFRQKPGTGIDLSTFEEAELCKGKETSVYPVAVKVEATPSLSEDGKLHPVSNLQITEAVFENNKGEYKVKVVNQILWVEGLRYDLQEIYGIGNSVDDDDYDGNDLGKECVICLSKPRDTTVLPCRHMCMCSGCAKSFRFQTNHCPICRQPVKRLLEIKVNSGAAD